MANTDNHDDVGKLLSFLDREQLEEFIRSECDLDSQLRDRFLALGAGTLFTPEPSTYSSRVLDVIGSFRGRYNFVEHRDTYDVNCGISLILEEAERAIEDEQWDVAIAVLTGVSDEAETILNCGDDSDGELGAVVSDCFSFWTQLASQELPDDVKCRIFDLAMARFHAGDLEDWDWWADWVEIAIMVADTQDQQKAVFSALDEIKPDENSFSNYRYEEAQRLRLKLMERCGTPEERRKYLYDNVNNLSFRRELLQMAWDAGDCDEVVRLAREGIAKDTNDNRPGLVSEWREWELKANRKRGNTAETIRLARELFLNGRRTFRFSDDEEDYSPEAMYSLMKANVAKEDWPQWVEQLLADIKYPDSLLLYVYVQENMWDRYMDYLRQNCTATSLDEAPEEVRDLYKDEFVSLYTKCVKRHFAVANKRSDYESGVRLLRKLIKYGGEKEAAAIIEEQKARRPRRPALIDELSQL